jgi:hypothetical protein
VSGNASPIALELFDRVDDYTAAISSGEITSQGSLNADTAIYIFYQNFFLQFFENALGLDPPINGFGEQAVLAATRVRLAMTGPETLPARRVIVQFEKFCEILSSLKAGQYYPSSDAFVRFHKLYIPRLLRSIGAWAASAELPEIAERSRRAFDAYKTAVTDLEGQQPPDDTAPASDALKELIRIIELDYERTAKFIEGVIGTSATIRGLLITAWVAVITLAFDTTRWALAAVSFVIVVVFGLLDAYHSSLYQQALGHASELEGISQAYYGAIALGADDPDADFDLQVGLQAHSFGVYRNLRGFTIADLRSARPQIFFAILYPALLVVSIICTVILAVIGKSG